MPNRLDDKVCIVTGGGAGLGQATSLLFSEEGARVVIADVDAANGAAVARQITDAGGQAIAIETDVANNDHVVAMVDAAMDFGGKIDVLVNNAAVGGDPYNYTVVDGPIEKWRRCTDVNLLGPFLCMKHVVPHMLKREKGSIVNVVSISSVVGLMMQSIYAPAKAGILQLTRTAAIDYARNGIRVNCVLPGGMHTPMFEDELAKAPRELVEKERELQPMGRFADPREVAYVILFLAGDEASYVNGAGWSVDGGYTAQ